MKHGIADVIREVKSVLDFQETCGPLLDAVRKLMKACEDARDIRHGAKCRGLLHAVGVLVATSSRFRGTGAGEATTNVDLPRLGRQGLIKYATDK